MRGYNGVAETLLSRERELKMAGSNVRRREVFIPFLPSRRKAVQPKPDFPKWIAGGLFEEAKTIGGKPIVRPSVNSPKTFLPSAQARAAMSAMAVSGSRLMKFTEAGDESRPIATRLARGNPLLMNQRRKTLEIFHQSAKLVALLKVEGKDLASLPLGSSEKIEAGIRIVVIGSPLGLEGTLSEGIISAVREFPGRDRWLQISAAISPGSSGSPVMNAKGEVIGIATLLLTGGQSLNFAVPIEAGRVLLARTQKTDKPQPLDAHTITDCSSKTSPDRQGFGEAIPMALNVAIAIWTTVFAGT
ncbi:MAG: trypsin-like peptidase domain-containing protein [Verrucomicrobia bacterium]|nr:trypsin-like peptidase domain-containing protein [Verrucomicrobiota bacterium]